MVQLSRRSFLGGVLTVAAMSAVPEVLGTATVGTGPIIPTLWSDGIHDDWEALMAFTHSKPFQTADGFRGIVREGILEKGNFLFSKPIIIPADTKIPITFRNCHFIFKGPNEYWQRMPNFTFPDPDYPVRGLDKIGKSGLA